MKRAVSRMLPLLFLLFIFTNGSLAFEKLVPPLQRPIELAGLDRKPAGPAAPAEAPEKAAICAIETLQYDTGIPEGQYYLGANDMELQKFTPLGRGYIVSMKFMAYTESPLETTLEFHIYKDFGGYGIFRGSLSEAVDISGPIYFDGVVPGPAQTYELILPDPILIDKDINFWIGSVHSSVFPAIYTDQLREMPLDCFHSMVYDASRDHADITATDDFNGDTVPGDYGGWTFIWRVDYDYLDEDTVTFTNATSAAGLPKNSAANFPMRKSRWSITTCSVAKALRSLDFTSSAAKHWHIWRAT